MSGDTTHMNFKFRYQYMQIIPIYANNFAVDKFQFIFNTGNVSNSEIYLIAMINKI